jgi:hypothetical protein
MPTAPPSLVVCLRHAEKPANAEDPAAPLEEDGPGFDQCGRVSPHSLTIKGWERAYALGATDFCGQVPLDEGSVVILVPDYHGNAERRRPYQTVLPFSLRRGIEPQHPCKSSEIDTLCHEVTHSDGIVVVCWEHKHLEELVQALIQRTVSWPPDRFDLIWLVRPSATDEKDKWQPVPQLVVRGDQPL